MVFPTLLFKQSMQPSLRRAAWYVRSLRQKAPPQKNKLALIFRNSKIRKSSTLARQLARQKSGEILPTDMEVLMGTSKVPGSRLQAVWGSRFAA